MLLLLLLLLCGAGQRVASVGSDHYRRVLTRDGSPETIDSLIGSGPAGGRLQVSLYSLYHSTLSHSVLVSMLWTRRLLC